MVVKDIIVEYVAGAVSGSAGVLFGHPLDTVKCQLQVQRAENKYKGLWDCCLTVHKQGMSHGFFRGLSWPLCSYGLVNSVFFGTYTNVLRLFGCDNVPGHKPEFVPILVAGAVGGMAQLTVSVPVEVIKVVLQSQIHDAGRQQRQTAINKDYYKGPREGVMDIVRTKGLRGMYRGYVAQLYRDIPASAAYFPVFEFSSYYGHKYLPNINSQLINFIAGGLAGLVTWTMIMPLDVVKSRVQADVKGNVYTGLWDCAVKSVQSEGTSVLFRGYTAVATRAFLVNSVTLLVYVEMLKAYKYGWS